MKSRYGYFNGISTWVAGRQCNLWSRVTCNADGDVIGLNFYNARIRWTTAGLVPAMTTLTALESLNFFNNGLVSEATTVLTKLTRLTGLNLARNNFHGALTNLWLMTQLTSLDISSNIYSGRLNSQLGALSNLEYLDFSGNLFMGPIPAAFSNLTKLQTARFDRNYFSALPASLPSLDPSANLTFTASYNLISKVPITFPASATSNVLLLDLSFNHIRYIPTEFSLMSELKQLNFANNLIGNDLAGISWASLTNLELLNLGHNRINCSIPVELASLDSLKYLYLHTNRLTGSLPDEITLLTNLEKLDIGLNPSLGGEIPVGLNDLTSLWRLVLVRDNFTGPLPQPFNGGNATFYLDARNNSFTGTPKVQSVCPTARPKWLRVEFNCLDDEADCDTNQRVCT
eukprot:TRINITY_DN15166_c0_g1_i1.p1 TRINITY_DN15166_c0_g1~~TRINITY_DN15166_c0_g1_i1.p1  ORF type:complete len:408 (-),score=2.03 TRINITY_DN15166_c0_g1_i1:117-1319(-)